MLCCKERRRGGANSTYASLSKICVIKSRRRMFLTSVFVLVRRRLRKICTATSQKGGKCRLAVPKKSQDNQRNGRKGRRNHGRKGKGEGKPGKAVSQKERAEWHAIPNSNSDTAMSSPPSNEGERGVGVDPTRPDPTRLSPRPAKPPTAEKKRRKRVGPPTKILQHHTRQPPPSSSKLAVPFLLLLQGRGEDGFLFFLALL